MTQQTTVPAVHAAIIQVADALRERGVKKENSVSGGGNYKYRGIDDVYQALSPLLVKAQLYIAPVRIEKEPESLVGTKMRLIRLHITYRVTCVSDGSFVEVVTIGDGLDTGDKASGKAMSYAYKSLMFQLFCIPVEGQPDTDTDASPAEPQVFLSEATLASAHCAADSGTAAYRDFFKSITMQERQALNSLGWHEKLKIIAKVADASEDFNDEQLEEYANGISK